MKKFVLRFFAYIAILYLVDSMISGLELINVYAVLIISFFFTLVEMALKPVIKFLTIPTNFVTFMITNFILSAGLLFLCNIIVPGFALATGTFGPVSGSEIEIPEIKLSQIGVIILGSFFIALFNNIINWTQSSNSKKEKE